MKLLSFIFTISFLKIIISHFLLIFRTILWVVLSVFVLICRIVIAEAFLALNILVNNSVEPHLIGTANGLAMSFSSGGRLVVL